MTARLTGPGPTPGWRPLPECPVCGVPVARSTHSANGGTCTECRGLLPDLRPADPQILDLGEWQALVARRGAEDRERARQREARLRARREARRRGR